MKKVKKGKRLMAAALAVVLSVVTATTNVLPSAMVQVHAAETTQTSDVEGFTLEISGDYGYYVAQKEYQYDSYEDAIKDLGAKCRAIFKDRKSDAISIKIPMVIQSKERDERLDENKGKQFVNDVAKIIFQETENAEEGNLLKDECYMDYQMNYCDYEYKDGTYAGMFYVSGMSHSLSVDRYNQTVKKGKEIISDLNLDGKSDYEKVKAIIRWFSKNVKYDNHYYGEPEKEAITTNPYDFTGPILDGGGVCDGYANAFYFLGKCAGLKVLYQDGATISGTAHALNLVEVNGKYYYIDPTNIGFVGEPSSEFLHGQNYMSTIFKLHDLGTEEIYDNISKEDYSKEHSVCNGDHKLSTAGGYSGPRCEVMGYNSYICTNEGCNYVHREWIPALEHIWDEGTVTQEQSCTEPEITTYKCTRDDVWGENGKCTGTKEVETKSSLGGHTWDEGKVTTEATCQESGEKTYTCSTCNSTKTEEIAATGHEWEEKVIKEATCTQYGTLRQTCKHCGFGQNKKIPATGHLHTELKNVKAATCENTGYTGDKYCTDCKRTYEMGTEVEALGHDWKETSSTGATCEKGIITTFTCSNCEETKEEESGEPLGHVWGEWTVTKEPTCTKYGVKKHYCTRSGCTEYEIDTVDKTEHVKETRNQKAATCTETGYSGDIYCKNCDTVLEEGKEIAATGHTWDEGTVTKEPTETENGVKTYTCKNCDATKTEEIPMETHHWDEGTVTKKATCTEAGKKKFVCTDEGCTKTYTVEIPATGHQHTEILNKKDAGCESEGYTGDTYCKDCEQIIKAGTATKATGHTWDEGKVTKEATCKEKGEKTYTCKECQKTKVEELSKTEHQWDEGTVTKKATCEEAGEKTYTCKNCNATKTEEIKATGHIHTEIRDQKAATCKATGYTGDTYCTDCKKLISKGKEIAKRSHDWKIEEKKATCEKAGERTSTCKSCGEIKTETLSATGHKYGAWKTISTATVFAPAKQIRHCSVCGKSETRTYGSKLRATIKMNATSLKLKRKQSTTKFKATGLAKGDYVRSWTTSNKKIATVTGSKNGTCKIKAGSKTGTAKITITLASGLRKTISVKVQKGTVTCTSIKGIPKKVTIKRRKSYQLRAAVNPFTCTTKVKYKSSNSKIAKVTSKGKITAGKKKGKAKITISVGKKKFVCTVTVK